MLVTWVSKESKVDQLELPKQWYKINKTTVRSLLSGPGLWKGCAGLWGNSRWGIHVHLLSFSRHLVTCVLNTYCRIRKQKFCHLVPRDVNLLKTSKLAQVSAFALKLLYLRENGYALVLKQFVIFNTRKVPWNWIVFYQNSFVILPG